MNINQFKGLGVAMVTPFTEAGDLDIVALQKHTQFLIEGEVDYLVVQGTTGESPVLSQDEKQLVLDTVCEENSGHLPIVFGIGGNNTSKVVSELESYDLSGVSAILSASPYYNKPTQAGIYEHYKAIAQGTDLPIILYNVPGRTSSNILAETTLKLGNDFKNIIAVKEASGNMEQVMNIINEKPKDFLVISGDDALTLPILACGGDGVISVIGNAFPKEFGNMVHYALENDMDKARKEHYKLLPLNTPLYAEGNPGGIKEILAYLGIMSNKMRLPLVNVSDPTRNLLIKHTRNIYGS